MNETGPQQTSPSPRNPEFGVHMLNEEGKQKARYIQDTFDTALNALTSVCTDGRSFSIMKTKLEEACFFAKKAMAINLGNQQQ
jgi:hypothetical protein